MANMDTSSFSECAHALVLSYLVRKTVSDLSLMDIHEYKVLAAWGRLIGHLDYI